MACRASLPAPLRYGAVARRALPTIFIGSSSAAKSQARSLVKAFEGGTLKFLPWWDAFTPGRTLLGDLDLIKKSCDAALLVMSPESEATIRGRDVHIPNLNVLFEFGYFYGHLGPSRTATINYGTLHLPNDLDGYTHVTGSTHFTRGGVVAVGKRTSETFYKWSAQI